MISTRQSAERPVPAEPAPFPPEFAGGGRLSRVQPGVSLRHHKRLATLLFLLVFLAGLPVAWFQGRPVYATQSVVYISPRVAVNWRGGAEFQPQPNAQYREYVRRNARTISRADVVQGTLNRLDASGRHEWRLPYEDDRHAAERLANGLAVTALPETYQVRVELRGDRPERLAETLNTLLDVYLSVQRAEEFYGVEGHLAALREEKDSLARELLDDQARLSGLARQTGVSTFNESHANLHDQMLASARQALADARRQRIVAAEQFSLVDPSRGSAAKQALDTYAREMARKDWASSSSLSGANARLVDEYARMVLAQRRAEVQRTERIEKALAAEVAGQESRTSSVVAQYQEGLRLSQRIDQVHKRQEVIEEQQRLLELASRAPAAVRVLAQAQPATLQVGNGRVKLLVLFTLAGLAIALLVPVVLDMFDPRLLTPSDAGRALHCEPLGWLPEREEGGDEFTWELVLRIANWIDQERQAHGTRIWMFTAVKPGGGTTTLVNSIGRALTLIGVPTLAVEANAYRPDGRFARGSMGLGLTALLHGHATLSESIETADEEMPDHIPVGELDASRHLPDIHRLMPLLEETAESYALVLVDIPPVLFSVDAEYLVRRADCAVLVAEARQVTIPELKRAARLLKQAQARNVTCLLNRVRGADGSGFAREAKREFLTGASKQQPAWQQPWLWK